MTQAPNFAQLLQAPQKPQKKLARQHWRHLVVAVQAEPALQHRIRREAIEERFLELAGEWREASAPSSSTLQMAMHPAYQKIMAMGPDAVPLILGELSREADHWFWALEMITDEDPVRPEDRGDIEEMRKAWLQWGKTRGYDKFATG